MAAMISTFFCRFELLVKTIGKDFKPNCENMINHIEVRYDSILDRPFDTLRTFGS